MKIEAGLVDRKRQGNCQLPKEMSRSSKKNRRGQKKSMTVVQKLFETCRDVFSASGAGIVPSPGDVERIRLVLDSLKPDHVGLSQEMPYFRTEESDKAPPVTYMHLYECDKFSIGIFCLPPSAVIPLHNHPGMTVFSKLLFGSMHIKSYDWADIPCSSDKTHNPSHFQVAGKRLAKVKTDAVFTAPCNTSILYPAEGGNMHRFTAKTSCAVLDVLGPPYSDPEGRHCTYYRDFPYASFSVDKELGYEGEGFAWLEEKEKLEDLSVLGAPYMGPNASTIHKSKEEASPSTHNVEAFVSQYFYFYQSVLPVSSSCNV